MAKRTKDVFVYKILVYQSWFQVFVCKKQERLFSDLSQTGRHQIEKMEISSSAGMSIEDSHIVNARVKNRVVETVYKEYQKVWLLLQNK